MAVGREGFGIVVTMAMVAALLTIVVMPEGVSGRPSGRIVRRQKRVSDQRMAELETLIALQHLKGHLVTVPVAFGKVDPALIGRRRRSSPNQYTFQTLHHNMNFGVQDSNSDVEDGNEVLSVILKNLSDRREDEDDGDYQLI